MIEITGNRDCPEYEAALDIKNALEKLWPGVGTSPVADDHIKIISSVKLSGYKVSDIDIVIAASFSKKRYIVPKSVFVDKDGKRVTGAKILVRSFICAVELKDHGANGVRFEGGNVIVKYREGWKSATDQNEAQKYALRNYLRDRLASNPWVYRCLYLRGLQELPTKMGRKIPESGAVAADLDGTKLIMAMANVNGISKHIREYVISSASTDILEDVFEMPLFTSVVPSELDRKRMDRIAAQPALARELAENLGAEFLHLRGQGGTGKTVLLLQTAYEAYQSKGTRSLILTYNHALAADIQRLLALMGIPSSDGRGGIDVRTIVSFMSSWLEKFDLIGESEDFYPNYRKNCATGSSYIREGLITPEDILAMKSRHPDQFEFDAILIDEAQDLPRSEQQLITDLYGQSSIAIGDGMSQLVRGRPTDWKSAEGRVQPRNFKECLRMKSRLGTFANAVAKSADINWRIKPNTQAVGGRIILLKRPYEFYNKLREDLAAQALAEGNSPVDFLHCVSPDNVKTDGNRQISKLGEWLQQSGLEVWDGVDEMTRRDFPRSTDSYRIVQYPSCRGLEGWLVVLDGLDKFWSLKYNEHCREFDALEDTQTMQTRDRYARSRAWEWILMALTRPINTVVIALHDLTSDTSKLLLDLAKVHPDLIEIID